MSATDPSDTPRPLRRRSEQNKVHPPARPFPAMIPKKHLLFLAGLGAFALSSALPANAESPSQKIAVHSADDLPRHTYAVSEAPSKLVKDDAAFAAFAAAVKKDIETDLAAYDIQD